MGTLYLSSQCFCKKKNFAKNKRVINQTIMQGLSGMLTCSMRSFPVFLHTSHLGGKKKCQLISFALLFATPWTVCSPSDSCPWDSLGKNTRAGCHSLLQGIFTTQGLSLGFLYCRKILYHLNHQGSLSPILATPNWVKCLFPLIFCGTLFVVLLTLCTIFFLCFIPITWYIRLLVLLIFQPPLHGTQSCARQKFCKHCVNCMNGIVMVILESHHQMVLVLSAVGIITDQSQGLSLFYSSTP